MFQRAALRVNTTAALVIVLAASIGALLAHVGIDIAGDVVLAHDSYDGLDHGSRAVVLGVALLLACAAMLHVVRSAFDEARTRRAAVRRSFDAVFGRQRHEFVIIVVLLSVPTLMSMEALDAAYSGTRVDDISDLLGGSLWLGLGITSTFAAIVAIAVRSITSWVLESHSALVACIGRAIALLVRARPARFVRHGRPMPDASRTRRFILARRAGKRGPPLLHV